MSLKDLFATKFVDKVLVPISRRMRFNHLNDYYRDYAAREAAKYVFENMPEAMMFENKDELLRYSLEQANIEGLIAEFGVHQGRTLNIIARTTQRNVYGFDSFEGLREDWSGTDMEKGTFDVGSALPDVPANAKLLKGWFQDTLEPFLAENSEPAQFIHIDCDTYPSSKYVLDQLRLRLRAGTIIKFNEYIGFLGWPNGEFRAWKEFCAENDISFRYIGGAWQSVSVEIL